MYYALIVIVRVFNENGDLDYCKEVSVLTTSNELRVKKGLLAIRQFLGRDLDAPLLVKDESSAQHIPTKLEAFRL